jgi:hypothetical protein
MSEADTWQKALAAEQQAVFGFGIVGGQLGPSDELAHAALDTHRQRAADCESALRALGDDPDPGPAAFTPDHPVKTDDQARALATQLEQGCSSAYADLVLLNEPKPRRSGAAWLRDSAIDQYRWSGELPALPGLAT